MKVRIRRIDKNLPLPEYKTKGAVAFDLAARMFATVAPKSIAYIPLNAIIEAPENHMLMLAARSSLHKKGLMLANGVGVVDRDFCGNDDEWHAVVYNFTDAPVEIEKGERIAQGILKRYEKAEWEEVDNMQSESRGGFGSTGLS